MWQRNNSKLIFENSLQAFNNNNNNNNNNNGFSWGKRKGGITHLLKRSPHGGVIPISTATRSSPALGRQSQGQEVIFGFLSSVCQVLWLGWGSLLPTSQCKTLSVRSNPTGDSRLLSPANQHGGLWICKSEPLSWLADPCHFPPSLQIRFSESQLRGFLEMPSFPSWLRICRPLWRFGAWTAQLPTALASAPDLCLRVPWCDTPKATISSVPSTNLRRLNST